MKRNIVLSSGEFVGMVADDPDQKIELKAFHCEIQNDHETLKMEQENYKPMPMVRQADNGMIQRNYLQIKQDVEDLLSAETDRMMGESGAVGTDIKEGMTCIGHYLP